MSLHVLAAIYSSLGRFEGAIPVLEWAIQVPDPPRGADHALAAFSDHTQLGDMFSMLGKVDCSIACYEEGLKIQIEALGDTDHASVKLAVAGLIFRAFDLLNVDRIAIEKCVC